MLLKWITNLKAEKSVTFLGVTFDSNKLIFEEHIKDKIHNTQHITSSYYSLRSQQYRIPVKTMINLYKIFIRPNFGYGNATLITAETKYIWDKLFKNRQSKICGR